MMTETYVQRMRVTFRTDDTVKYAGHLDMHRTWERAIRRAQLPLAYTQGFNPQARIQFAAAMPVGFTGCAELADVYLNEALDPAEFCTRLAAALPLGIRPLRAEPESRETPSLQSQVTGAHYLVQVETAEDEVSFCSKLDVFLACANAWRERRKGKDTVRYDLRPLIQTLTYDGRTNEGHAFRVVMRAEPGATGRPDELLAELGYERAPRRIERTALLFL